MSMPIVPETAARPPLGRRLAARFAVGLAAVCVRLSPLRLAQVLRVLSRGARPADRRRALEARQAVVHVSVRCAGQGCLQRSVATVLLCRLTGTWPDWCTGARTQPFRAHAWVEAGGVPVGEPDDTPLYQVTLSVRHRT
ncbi:lasso peptide biosynthesis B2 protein [Streptomyces iconiensis]|uniref:Lasso peptide biosynthesis B2 protein n=2 Tax=Streptomyces iconiensis TaxID=1384038 RepID=A0ABT7A0M4_9ACTN|nr:lasso peptide biosynthesis B2 protein [Streptomyces iconiensis]MDJ1134871.1 lasso peptide biosynthesis B2 protein [Streptomyces iconiensis]